MSIDHNVEVGQGTNFQCMSIIHLIEVVHEDPP